MADIEKVESACEANTSSDAEMVAESEPLNAFDLILPSDEKLKASSIENIESPHDVLTEQKQEPDEEPTNPHDNNQLRDDTEHAKSPDEHEPEVGEDAETEAGDEKPVVEPDSAVDDDDDMDKHSHGSGSEGDAEVLPCEDSEAHAVDPEDADASPSSAKCRKSSSRARPVSRRWMLSKAGADGTPKRRSERLQCKNTPPKVTGPTAGTSPRSAASKLIPVAGRDKAAKHLKESVKSAITSSVRRASNIGPSNSTTRKDEVQTVNKKVKVSVPNQTSDPVGKSKISTRHRSVDSRQTSMDNSDVLHDKTSNASRHVTRGSCRKTLQDHAGACHTNKVISKKPRGSSVSLPHVVDEGAQNRVDDLKVKLEAAAKSEDYSTCVQIEQQIAAMSQSESKSTNKDPQEALSLRIAVVNGLLEQAGEAKQYTECLCYQKELADLNSQLESIRTVSEAMVSLQIALDAARSSKNWIECDRISRQMKDLDTNISRKTSDVGLVSSAVEEDTIVRRIASLQKELDAACDAGMFVHCQQIQDEMKSLQKDLEDLKLSSRVAGPGDASARAQSSWKQISDLQEDLHRAKIAEDFQECIRISTALADLQRSSHLDKSMQDPSPEQAIQQKMSSLKAEQCAASDAGDFVKCLAIATELSQLETTMPARDDFEEKRVTMQETLSQLESQQLRAKDAKDYKECVRLGQQMQTVKNDLSSLWNSNAPGKVLAKTSGLIQGVDAKGREQNEEKRVSMQETLSQLQSQQLRAKEANDYKECLRLGHHIQTVKEDLSSLCNSKAPGTVLANTSGLVQGVDAKGGEKMSIQAIMESSTRLPPRVSLSSVRVAAVGKVTADASAVGVKGSVKGKGKSVKGGAKGDSNGMSKGKGKASVQKVVLHVFDEETGFTITLHWKKATLSVAGLEKSLANIFNATPVRSDSGQVSLELDHRSDVKSLLNTRDAPFDLYAPIASTLTMTINVAGSETIGSYADIVLRCQHVAMKSKSDGSGDQFLQVNWVDLEGQMMQMPVFDHEEREFQEGDIYIAWGLAVKPFRFKGPGGYWTDDPSWGSLKYSGWSTAFVNVPILIVSQTHSS